MTDDQALENPYLADGVHSIRLIWRLCGHEWALPIVGTNPTVAPNTPQRMWCEAYGRHDTEVRPRTYGPAR